MKFKKQFDDFDPKKKIELLVANRDLWKKMRESKTEIINLGFCTTIPKEQFSLAFDAMQTVVSDYAINEQEYSKYKEIKYFDVRSFKILMQQKKDLLEDPSLEKEIKYIEKSRSLLWGYITSSIPAIAKLFLELGENIHKGDKYVFEKLSKQDHKILSSCVLAIAIECIIRDREGNNLEDQYRE